MAMPCSLAAPITSSSRSAATWMNHARRAGFQPTRPCVSRNGKKASLATAEPFNDKPAASALMPGDARRIEPAHLARRPRPRACAAGAEDDGVALHVLAHRPGEQHVLQLLRRGLRLGDDLQVGQLQLVVVSALDQEARADALHVLGVLRPAPTPGGSAICSTRTFFFRAAKRASASGVNDGGVIRHFHELLGHLSLRWPHRLRC